MPKDKFEKIFEAAGVDALYIEADFLRRYITGFYSTDGYVILDGKSCRYVADLRYFEAAEKALAGSPVQVVEGSYKEAMELLKPYKTLGVPYPYTDLERAEDLRGRGYVLKDCMPALKDAMVIKTDRELDIIQTACTIAEDGFLATLPEIREGMTESQLAALLEYNMRKFGASGTSFETICAFGAGASVPHHETGETKLKFGDPILIDFGCKAEGYCSDITRTFLFGDDGKHEDFKKAYKEVLKAHELVKEKVVSGMTGKEADEVARGSLRAAGLDKLFTHSLGHGVGLLIHEYPRLSPGSNEVLQNGMVFSDEPGVYEAGKFGIRIEDTVCLKDGKIKSFMSKTEHDLLIL